MSARGVSWLVWCLWALCAALVALGVLLYGVQSRSLPDGSPFSPYLLNNSVAALAFSTVGALVASRRPENPIGWLFGAAGFLYAIAVFAGEYSAYVLTGPRSLPGEVAALWFGSWAWVPAGLLILFLFLLFPDGRPPSPRWRAAVWLAAGAVLLDTASYALRPGPLLESDLRGLPRVENPLAFDGAVRFVGLLGAVSGPLTAILVLAPVAAVVVRFRRSGGEERQQIKWVAYAATILTIAVGAMSVWPTLDASAVGRAFFLCASLAIPTAMGIAILRHRLYDIDLLINRTLVYGVLTASLALVYVAGVVLSQALFRSLTGQESQLAVVGSTLAIAALFGPLRRRIQRFIDRRFYRQKYDAARVLADFNARLRDEVDLDALSGDLLGVVEETVRPEHVSLWLRPPDKTEKSSRSAGS